jgi:hypothetical protein
MAHNQHNNKHPSVKPDGSGIKNALAAAIDGTASMIGM